MAMQEENCPDDIKDVWERYASKHADELEDFEICKCRNSSIQDSCSAANEDHLTLVAVENKEMNSIVSL